jgi:hypothetical protein
MYSASPYLVNIFDSKFNFSNESTADSGKISDDPNFLGVIGINAP